MTRSTDDDCDRLAYSIAEFQVYSGGLSRTTIYREIREGRLKAKKIRGRRVIPRDDALDWIRQKDN